VTNARDREAFDQAVARGSEQLKLGKLGEALGEFRIAPEHDPESTRVLALLGLTHFRANQFEEARPIYEQLVERAPTDPSHRLNLGLVYLKLNQADDAIHALEASRALDPSQGRAVSYLGLAYARAGRYTEAYRSFLLAGQHDLAREIELNLTAAEREGIQGQLGRIPPPAHAEPVAAPAAPAARATTSPPASEPRTKPPSAPPRTVRASGEIVAPPRPEAPPANAVPAADARISDSMVFVLPKPPPVAPHPVPGESMISQAVAAAAPSNKASAAERTKAGGTPPRPLSELATDDLLRPEEGDEPFEIAANGALILRITDRVMTRLDGVHISGGDLSYERAMRRSRGHQTDEPFDHGGSPLHVVSGHGYLVAVPGKHAFSAVSLDDDILYLREDLVFAFESTLRWESGNVPGLRGKLPVVQFRGDGALALRTARPLVRVKLAPQGIVFIDAERLAGWIGRVIPRAVVPPLGGPMGATCVECTGEGIVLIEPAPEREPVREVLAVAPAPAVRATPPPPPAPSSSPTSPAAPPPIDPELDMSSLTSDAHDGV